jgi:hypothetical protein
MNYKVRVIKRGDRREPKHDRQQQPSSHATREITTTIKLWVSEFKQSRRRDEPHPSLTPARVEEGLIKSFRT